MLVFDDVNDEKGRDAMMYATYFYYQLIEEGGFSVGQTSYWLYQDYTCWELLEVELDGRKGCCFGIDPDFLMEAATVYILCMATNVLFEQDDALLSFDDEIIKALVRRGCEIIPEARELVAVILVAPNEFDAKKYYEIMEVIFTRYVRGRFIKLLG